MIGQISMNQMIDDKTHDSMRETLRKRPGASKRMTKCVYTVEYPTKMLRELTLYYGIYSGIRSNIVMVCLDFADFKCTYEDFPAVLYDNYLQLFGPEIMAKYPPYDHAVCDNITYTAVKQVENSDAFLRQLAGNGKFSPEQLDRSKWDGYNRSSKAIKLLLCKEDDTHVLMEARCPGAALQARIKDPSAHGHGGVLPSVAVNHETETMVFDWLCSKNNVVFPRAK